MSCSSYREWISLHVGGDLEADRARRLDAHLPTCESCRSFSDAMRSTQGALQRSTLPPLGESQGRELRRNVLQQLQEEGIVKSPARSMGVRRWWPAAVAAGLVAVLALGGAWNVAPRDGREARPSAVPVVEPVATVVGEPPVVMTDGVPESSAGAPTADPDTSKVVRSAARAATRTVEGVATPRPKVQPPTPNPAPTTAVASAEPPSTPARAAASSPPMLVKIVSADEDIVIYWQLHGEE